MFPLLFRCRVHVQGEKYIKLASRFRLARGRVFAVWVEDGRRQHCLTTSRDHVALKVSNEKKTNADVWQPRVSTSWTTRPLMTIRTTEDSEADSDSDPEWSRVSRFSPGPRSRPADYFRLRQLQSSRSRRRHHRRDELFLDESRRSTCKRRQRSSSSSVGSSALNDDIVVHDVLVGCRTAEAFSRELLLRVGNACRLCTRVLFHKL